MTVEVGRFQMAQFIAAQAGGVESGKHRPVFEIVGVVENTGDFFHAEHAGEGGPAFGPGDLVVEPLLLERGNV